MRISIFHFVWLLLTASPLAAATATIAVDAGKRGPEISPDAGAHFAHEFPPYSPSAIRLPTR